ncbi:hypothetical protein PoB_005912400 [Plakobranchus ocellatus]|uniref:Uncharacterized protein n=1 Tax=Plakobranchus ocellatus TaxID=259542 RepID=A0AAV4CMJ6_9GAST|nr:hypothetical protein PoB_005912400 [Plakobranchus ocellatus]
MSQPRFRNADTIRPNGSSSRTGSRVGAPGRMEVKNGIVRSAISSNLRSIIHLIGCDCILRHVSKSAAWKRYDNDHVNVYK